MALVFLSAALPALAHHAVQAQFDFDKPIQLKGTLAKIEWVNPHELIFLYQTKNTYRLIPINGKHPPADELEGTWNGDSIAYWEGDTMVIDSIGFNDFGWLGWPGYFHSEDLHVIEKLRRVGNVLNYQSTAEDSTVLMKPWVLNPRTLLLNTDPKGTLPEELPCAERSLQHMTTKERG